MSDPMSSVEIEDVLSSIRRLVSEDLRPPHRPTVGLAVPAARRDRAEKLILTPALRVDSEPAVAAPAPPADAWVDEILADDGAPMIEMAGWPPLDWRAAEAEILALRTIDPAPGWAQEDPGEPEIATAPVEAEAVPDADWVDQAEAEVIATLDDAEAEDVADTAPATDTAPVAVRVPVAVILPVADSAPEGFSASFDDAEPEPDPGGMLFDEVILRDLVREMIREELQGGLGERITRNVRKLVRQEIARALAARDLE